MMFETEYLCVPVKRQSDDLIALADKYDHLTESFDRSVCTGPIINGSIRPSNGEEFRLINQNAKKVLQEVMNQVPGREKELMDLIRNWNRIRREYDI